ncbi:AHH domain-containing protein [Capnocytophaga sputigena]|jgi:hypothetical protein|uniref:AHH domain-containing protein n=1 Tax=Capnocytophaga sputigena TaxID=1019 RepID=UPI0028D3415F|nr:AHH domain-containing protein [Capnocytophaga sputigena]
MKNYLFCILSVIIISLFSCNKKISIEKKWVTTDNNYLLLTQPNDSLSYHWEGGVFENVIHGKGTLSAYYNGKKISSNVIEAYYGATSQQDIVKSNNDKYIGNVKEEKFVGFGVWIRPKEIYVGEFLESQPNGYLSYYKDGKLSYKGEWQKGKRSGRGTNYKENGKVVSGIWKDNKIFEADTTITTTNGIYRGLLRNSLPQGYGELNYFSGSQYRGNWDKGKWHGEGSFTSATDTIIGEWAGGELNGYGLYKTPYVLLEGNFKNHNLNGEGYMLLSDSTFYSGTWAKGKKSGYGDITLSNGDTYMGSWENDQYSGEGRYTYHTGEIYDGHWKNGQQDSLGKYICKEFTYVGNWAEGWINGQGKITYPNGDYYEGDFVENQKYGIGYYHFKDGNAYDGEFVDNKFNGLGVFTFKDGSRYQGEFRDGKIKGDGTLFLKEGKETIAITANWDGSSKFPKKASILFENGDLYEGELDNNGFPTKNGTWTTAQDREKQISNTDKANEFYKKHKNTWNNIVNYTSTALIVVAAVAVTPIAVAAVATVVVINVADAGVAVAHSEIEIKNAGDDKERIAQIKAERNAELLDNGVNIASALTVGYASSARATTEIGKTSAKGVMKTSAKQGLKTAGKNMLRNIDGQDVIDMTEAVIKKDKNGMLLTAGAVVAGAVVNVKLPKTSPIRKSIVKLSTVARQVGKSTIYFAKNKTFGKVVKLAKNSSGAIEKQWVQIVDKVWINSKLHIFTERLAKKFDNQFITQSRYDRNAEFVKNQDLGKSASGTILLKNLMSFMSGKEKRAILKEKLLSRKLGEKGIQAHHIVAGNSPTAKETRKMLEKCGIDINDARNGILLPMHPKSIFKGSLHGNHIRQYDEIVYQRILEAYKKTGKKGVEEALDNIKRDLYKGNVQLLSKDKHYVNRLWNSFNNIRR